MRIALTFMLAVTVVASASACATSAAGGALGEGAGTQARITGVDSALPPRSTVVQLDQPGYAALYLVAPGHSATLLYPADSATKNQLAAGEHTLRFEIPSLLAETDSQRLARIREAQRTAPARARTGSRRTIAPIPPGTVTYLLLLTSPQPLVYERLIEKTGGVSIPNIDMEALNAVAKAVKSTIPSEPRDWSGYYLQVELRRYR